ncbi:DNA polymerase IV [Agrobacterium rosae]|uniref:DNA polymerase IV n=1 Tax=Agrobacterium rosae TaxID=1972867 RepID=A0A1R3TC46_9HYPH|nr:DNA polymerase IV [Agrobacterium rosae]
MPVSKAQAILPGLIVEELQAAEDAKALRDLAFWFLRIYAPIVAPDPPDGLVLDTTGADHLHGNEHLMLTGMINRLHGLGFTARAAIADSWGAAHALARFGKDAATIVPQAGAFAALASLPLAALRLEPRTVADLKVLGFRHIGQLMATARAPVTLRFGPQVGRRLDHAHGLLSEPIEPIRVPELVEVFRFFAEPISAAETIARYTEKLVRRLCLGLEKRGLGARRVDLVLHRVDSGLQAIRAGTSKPVRDVKQLTRLLSDRIDTIDPGFGIEKMTLTATHAEALVVGQARSTLLDDAKAVLVKPSMSSSTAATRSIVMRQSPAMYPNVPSRWLLHSLPLILSAGRTTGHVQFASLPARSRSRQWHCCRIIRPKASHGAVSAVW